MLPQLQRQVTIQSFRSPLAPHSRRKSGYEDASEGLTEWIIGELDLAMSSDLVNFLFRSDPFDFLQLPRCVRDAVTAFLTEDYLLRLGLSCHAMYNDYFREESRLLNYWRLRALRHNIPFPISPAERWASKRHYWWRDQCIMATRSWCSTCRLDQPPVRPRTKVVVLPLDAGSALPPLPSLAPCPRCLTLTTAHEVSYQLRLQSLMTPVLERVERISQLLPEDFTLLFNTVQHGWSYSRLKSQLTTSTPMTFVLLCRYEFGVFGAVLPGLLPGSAFYPVDQATLCVFSIDDTVEVYMASLDEMASRTCIREWVQEKDNPRRIDIGSCILIDEEFQVRTWPSSSFRVRE